MTFKGCNELTFSNHEEWLKIRMTGIGGSDIGAIVGENKYTSPYKLFELKSGFREAPDLSNNEAVQRGNRAESPLRDLINAIHPEYGFYDPGVTFQRKDKPWMLANLDGLSKNKEVGLEIKTAKVRNMDEWTDCIPSSYYCQIQWYMAVTGIKKFIMYAYIERISFSDEAIDPIIKMLEIERDDEDIKFLEEEGEKFYKKVKLKEFGKKTKTIEV